jgi:RNA polymerase sigma-70 factor (ECF subfamily)
MGKIMKKSGTKAATLSGGDASIPMKEANMCQAQSIAASLNPSGYVTIGRKNAGENMSERQAADRAQARVSSSGFPLEWVRRSREGDSQAMELLYGRFKTSFFGLAYRYTYNAAAAEDILQDVFIKIFLHIHELDNDEAFVGWAYRIAVNTCLSYLRSHKIVAQKMVPFDVVEGIAQDKRAPDHERMFDRTMEDALQDLSTKLRSVFVLHDIQGFKHEEVAQILGCSSGTSKSQLFKARMKIRQRLQKKRLV